MNLSFLENIKRESFKEAATKLMNFYGIIKNDSRDNSDSIYRFAEIEFYLYDANEQDKDISTYMRDCSCVEWFFHASGVDIAFQTIKDNNELMRFGGILIRSIEIYKQDDRQQWQQIGIIGGPKLSMYEIFNHCTAMPDITTLPESFNKNRNIINNARIGIHDDLKQRFVFNDVQWDMKTERIVKKKDSENKYHIIIDKTKRKYNPKH